MILMVWVLSCSLPEKKGDSHGVPHVSKVDMSEPLNNT